MEKVSVSVEYQPYSRRWVSSVAVDGVSVWRGESAESLDQARAAAEIEAAPYFDRLLMLHQAQRGE